MGVTPIFNAESGTIQKVHKVNLGIMKKTSLDSNFQSSVMKIRMKFDIPKYGFDEGLDIKKWHEKLLIDTEKQLSDKFFITKRKDLDTKLNNGRINNLSEYKNEIKKLNNTVKQFGFTNSIHELLRKYNLPNNFFKHIKKYIIRNHVSAPTLNFDISLEGDNISIIIFQTLRKDEWVLAKKISNEWLKTSNSGKFNFLKKFNYPLAGSVLKPHPQIDRNIHILNKSIEKKIEPDYYDHATDKNMKITDEFVAEHVWDDTSLENIKNRKNTIRNIRSRFNNKK